MKDIHGGNIWQASLACGIAPQDIIDFSASINPLGIPKKAEAAIKRSLRLVSPYPDPDSIKLTEALSVFHCVPQTGILPGCGSTEFIYLIPQVFKPKRALIVEPAFSEYRKGLGLSGCTADSFILNESESFFFDMERFRKALKNSYDIVYVCNPGNPTGSSIEKDVIIEAARECAKKGTVLVVDEAFADFYEEESVKGLAAKLKNVIVLRSMTKFFAIAGLRLGFVISNKSFITRFKKHMPPWSVNTLASIAAVESLKDFSYMKKTMRWLKTEREFLSNGLGGIKGIQPYPTEANYIMARLETKDTALPVFKERLFKKGILIRDLSAFRGLGKKYIRVAVRDRKDNERLLHEMEEVLGKRIFGV